MTPERTEFETQLAAIRRDAQEVAAGLSEAQFNWRPGPGRWSIAECLEHLSVGARVVLPALDACLTRARERGLTGTGPFRYGWFARMMARSMEPPPRFRMKTWPQITPPPAPVAVGATLAEFRAAHEALAERWATAEGLDWARAIVQSPLSRLVRLPFGAYSLFLLAHARRHLWQARQVRQAPGFPAA
jgi:hypothetical protein